jgi:hypothetical protein
MSNSKKCQSKYGPAGCGDPNCPELSGFVPSYDVPKAFEQQSTLRAKPSVPFGAWTNKDTELFKTPHGSKLYGLSHANSDDDFFIVTPTVRVAKDARRNQAKQKFEGNNDFVFMDFKTFTRLAGEGVPQALETMYSRAAHSDYFEEYRQGYFCSDPGVIHRYMKTIKSFSMTEKDPFKRRRHALRLALNLEEILYTGRFNPTLTPENASRISRYAAYEGPKYFTELQRMSPVEVDWRDDFIAKEN